MEPWEEFPEIWRNRVAFFTWLRSGLRKAVWQFYPPKLKYKNSKGMKPPEDYTGKARRVVECELTGELVAISQAEIDHKEGHVSLKDWDDVLPFIQHLCAGRDNMAVVSKSAHKVKSYAERMGISFEEALCIKEAIRLCKEKKDLTFLEEREIIPATSQAKRRKQIENILLEELKNANQ